ncbi:hypothetical protein [Noviluteimonas gilva]|uniref:Lipoprotein n=1 Tax=Noviluteimonas gilva TaxID=2682097 RepID=A0A7C9HVI1_9GAMM|nr:hypothetical protein [Lysobacter gilvus]MUV14458.1 hypothetical protein [Lysobacter gilvus]
MAGRTASFAAAAVIACIAAACDGASMGSTVDYDTATATVAALVSAVAENDQAKVDRLTTRPGAVGGPPAPSTVADPFLDDPPGAMNDITNLRRYFNKVGKLALYEWDADFHALSVKFACAPPDGPRCINRLYFTFKREMGDETRVDMMIGVRNNPAWAKLWADLPNAHGLEPAAPAPAIEKAFAQFH